MINANYTFINVFQYQKNEVHFCTADLGWITGHTYLLYGPLSAGATTLMFEGVPTFPNADRLWKIIEKYKVAIFYTAPTALRSLMTYGEALPSQYPMPSLRVLGTVGEPINNEAWQWYHKWVGKLRCPIVDTWWQTETGSIMISNLAGITPAIPTNATLPLPGVVPIIIDEYGHEIAPKNNETTSGILCIKQAWPSMIRTTYNDHQRMLDNYFVLFDGLYLTGDGAHQDPAGNYRITGRIDDVINVSGHRIGTAELENAINQTENVSESAVVAMPHAIKGDALCAFVCANKSDVAILDLIQQQVIASIGAFARLDKIVLVEALPKTRSGKIMRRILRKIAADEADQIGDCSTLLDPKVVNDIIENWK
jgi:acetyl-CoA synthetase